MAYTDLTSMRNAFLTKTQAKLLAKDFSASDEKDLIITGAMVKAFDSVNNFDPSGVGGASGGASGGAGNPFTYLNDQVVTQDYTIPVGKNAFSAGVITIAAGKTVTIPDGSTWTIV
jgi:hypothetical protein